MMARDGWLARQIERTERNIAAWPKYLRDAAGLGPPNPVYMRAAAAALLREADEIERGAKVHERGA